ncbi:SlyX family protein [Microbulbifer sp. SAOS-129_SWC]|uniref:SlyX family protein n=1 Tax=Microbulbifer sp. SAOS-129_SWC TaxID=3145235 RepID=UPI003216BA47
MDKTLNNLAMRVEELESRVAFQEDTLSQLNDVIAAQDVQIRGLVARLRELGDRYRDLSFELQTGDKSGQEKPPHY